MSTAEISRYRGILANSVIFKGLEAPSLDRIIERSLALQAKVGDLVLYERGRGGAGIYVLLDGQVEVFRSKEPADTESEARIHLASLEPGHCFGEYSLIDGRPTSASVRALTAVKLFFLPRGEFLRVTENDPETGKVIYRNLLEFLIGRLRAMDILVLR